MRKELYVYFCRVFVVAVLMFVKLTIPGVAREMRVAVSFAI